MMTRAMTITVSRRSVFGVSGRILTPVLIAGAGCLKPSGLAEPSVPARVSVFEQFLLDEPGDDWTLRTPALWRIAREGDRRMLQMAIPPERPMTPGVRRPQEYALYNKYEFRSFSLSFAVRVDRPVSVPRRDAVVIFGRQDPTHFYYAHLSGASDQWHNAFVRVDGDSRTSLVPPGRRPPPTMTDQAWHKVDVVRDVDAGTIKVYVDAFDESAPPVFDLVDRTYEWGLIGLGSFDDHASFARIKIEGQARPPAAKPRVD
ncbi:MAG: hypothetical protein HRF43_20510 [Phycisphaerae bacterium]|jgi:hypothetical protein